MMTLALIVFGVCFVGMTLNRLGAWFPGDPNHHPKSLEEREREERRDRAEDEWWLRFGSEGNERTKIARERLRYEHRDQND